LAIAHGVHVAEFPRGVDVQQRERGRCRVKRLDRKVQHHRTVLADRIQHDGPFALSHHLTHDVDALSFQSLQMRQRRHEAVSHLSRLLYVHTRHPPALFTDRALHPELYGRPSAL
jgi:hypothetical protein